MASKLSHIAYHLVQTGKTDEDGNDIVYWNRIGAAFTNKDDSLSVVLSAFPIDGRLQLRPPKDKD